MFFNSVAACFLVVLLAFATAARSQLASPTPDAVRVTLSMNADGSRTVYEFDTPHHKATATTTKDGKMMGKIRYTLDDAGRFTSGEVYGADEQLRFKTRYKYDATGKLTEETQLAKDDAVRNKIVYAYDKNGKQTGYSVYDAAGKLIRSTPGLSPSASPEQAEGLWPTGARTTFLAISYKREGQPLRIAPSQLREVEMKNRRNPKNVN